MGNAKGLGLRLDVSDVTGQHLRRISDVDPEMSVADLAGALETEMNLPANTGSLYLEREGRHLSPGELVGDAVQNDDRLVVEPDISAGESS